ncbi:MAG: argininosuccinate synthase domain-containing protein [Campylobacter sp.]
MKKTKCLALFSGGLDSMIAVRLMAEQGVEVLALHFDIGFSAKDDKSAILRARANMAGGDFRVVDVRDRYLQDVLFSPKYGYGKHFNPCIDCHGYMAKTAFAMMADEGADFIITGEVVGQRPMSQRVEAMNQVKKIADDREGLILRPLCAKLLPPTRPEILGLIDREKLLDISGRGRTRQMELALKFGFSDYESPAGGCLLTIDSFANKIKDAIAHEKIESAKDAQILKFGRHLRLNGGAKMIIGRNESENLALRDLKNAKFDEILTGQIGAYCLIFHDANSDDLTFAAHLALAYSKAKFGEIYDVKIGEISLKIRHDLDKSAAQEYFIN